MIKILGIPAGTHATSYHRIIQPLHLLQTKGVEVQFLQEESEQLKQCDWCDVIFTQCLYSPSAYQFYRQQVLRGKKLVLDFDDDYFNVPEDSPEKMAVIDRKTGETTLFSKERLIYWVKAFLRLATKVIVPTQKLKELYEPYTESIEIIPNCVSLDMSRDIPKKSHNQPRVLWSGSASHLPDLKLLTETFAILNQHNIDIHLQGPLEFSKIFPNLKFTSHPAVAFSEYLNLIQSIDADIVLMPLQKNSFNAAKSNLKFLQMTLLETVCIASNFGPYAESIFSGKTGLLVANSEEWAESIFSVAQNLDLRKNLVDNALKFVKDNFLVEQHLHKWRQVLLE